MIKQKKIPMRKCTGCSEMKPKRELIRVVKSPQNDDGSYEISLDLTAKAAGRGAYVCRSLDCFEKAVKSRRFEKSLSCKIPKEVYELMRKQLEESEKSEEI